MGYSLTCPINHRNKQFYLFIHSDRQYGTYPEASFKSTLHDRYKFFSREMPVAVHVEYRIHSINHWCSYILSSAYTYSLTKITCIYNNIYIYIYIHTALQKPPVYTIIYTYTYSLTKITCLYTIIYTYIYIQRCENHLYIQ